MPNSDTSVIHSGGQQRRVSFAVALLHNPEILILDEPTVGVDPLLRQSIWTHLCSLVAANRTTVIITTHYIEEARQAHTIGLMRGGRLLAEDSPANLLKVHQCISLEDVFLRLCMKDKSTNNAITSPTNVANNNSSNVTSPVVPIGLNIVSVYNEKNKQYVDGAAAPEDNGIIGLAFHQSKEYLVAGGDNKSESGVSSNPEPDCTPIKEVAEDCAECISRPCGFNPAASLNRLGALMIKNFICMWRNIG
jgi:ABC-type multidrug transport system ATPase subunit